MQNFCAEKMKLQQNVQFLLVMKSDLLVVYYPLNK
jgi:hypothetical protein